MVPNHAYFVVRINKALQEKKRTELETFIYPSLGIFHDEKLHAAEPKGVIIDRIDPQGAAAAAGFQKGDRIMGFNLEEVTSYDHLQELINECSAGEEVNISYISYLLRDIYAQATSLKKVTLGSREVKIHLPYVTDMDRNLQWGTIVCMGSLAQQTLPQAQVGDILLIHHTVEYKPRMDGEVDSLYNDSALLAIEASGDELRIADARTQVFGSMNAQGIIYPHPDYIFCQRQWKPAEFQMKDGLWMPDGWELKHEEMVEKLEELKAQYESLTSASVLAEKTSEANYRRKEELGAQVNRINQEREEISIKMNQPRLADVTVCYINPQSCAYLGAEIAAGDELIADQSMLYPLQFDRFYFLLVRTRYTLAHKIRC